MGWFNQHGPTPKPPTPLRPMAVIAVPGAIVRLTGTCPSYPAGFRFVAETGVGDSALFPALPIDLTVANLFIDAPKYVPYASVVTIPALSVIPNPTIWVVPMPASPLSTWVQLPNLLKPNRPTPVARGPLPPIHFPGTYLKTLPWTPPVSRDYLRADAWGVTVPGAPFVPGLDPRQTDCLLTWFLDRYDPGWQERWIFEHAIRGYTHWIMSAGDSLGPPVNPGKTPGAGQTLAQFVATCRRIKQTIPYVTVFLGSKDFQPANMPFAQWKAYVDPIMDALIAADAVDEFVPTWEHNLWNVPGATTLQLFKHVGQKAHAAGRSCWMHYSTGYTSWFADGDPRGRFGFYADLAGDVDGLMYQADQNWEPEMLQARIVDSLWQFGMDGNRYKFRLYETDANAKFASKTPTEDDSNLLGYLGCCTVDNVKHTDAKVWGFGGGCRYPDGSVL